MSASTLAPQGADAAQAPQGADTAFGVLTDVTTLTIQRRLPGPIDRVWAYLTDSTLREQWLAAGVLPQQPGAAFELVWHNDALSASVAERPDGFADESRGTCVLTAIGAPHHLAFTWTGVGEVTFDLVAQGAEVLLTVTHRGLVDAAMTTLVGAGWHMHLDILVARVQGVPAPSFWSGWVRLRQAYAERLSG